MRPDSCWPQWLSVPAASDQAPAAEAGALRARLLRMVADHGVARVLPATAGSGPSLGASGPAARAGIALPGCLEATQYLAPRAGQHAVSDGVWRRTRCHCLERFQQDSGLHDGCALVSLSLLDLGRHDATRVESAAQRFDLGPGTFDSRRSAAMDDHQLDLALSAGRHAVERAKLDGVALIWAQGGGAGANTTNQAWGQRFRQMRDTPLPDDSVSNLAFSKGWSGYCQRFEPLSNAASKATDAVLILKRHASGLSDPYEALRCLGGFEHAALVGSALASAQLGLRWVADGESAEIAMLLAHCLNPSVKPWLRAESVLSACGCKSGRSRAHSCLQ